ncbi:MAG: DciA family protein [Microbacterium sp.]|uniref:DUF721 domain-containing protein n=1 Tax=Microbacterium sp. TaxID=51671 RepID=UPI0039E57D42
MTDPEVPETVAIYLRLRGLEPTGRGKRRRRRVEDDENAPFTPGRDPQGLGDVLIGWTAQAGWEPELSREDLIRQWGEVAGEGTAAHTRPTGLERGILTVACDSTAWAKQLRLMRAQIVTRIGERFPEAGVEDVRFIGPDVPSWKKGPRAVPGRGPRDTYG